MAVSFVSVLNLRFSRTYPMKNIFRVSISRNLILLFVLLWMWGLGWSLPHNAADFFGPGLVIILGGLG